MILSSENKFIFYHIPKASGTTIHKDLISKSKNAKEFWGIKENIDLAHLDYKESLNIIDENIINTYFKFCVVRNPYERVFSAFKNRLPELYRAKIIKNSSISFENFVFEYLNSETIESDVNFIHFKPMHFFTHLKNEKKINRIIFFENFFKEYTDTLKKLELPLNYSSYNISSYFFNLKKKRITIPETKQKLYMTTSNKQLKKIEKGLYKSKYSKKTINKINRLYEKDFKYFSYNIL